MAASVTCIKPPLKGEHNFDLLWREVVAGGQVAARDDAFTGEGFNFGGDHRREQVEEIHDTTRSFLPENPQNEKSEFKLKWKK